MNHFKSKLKELNEKLDLPQPTKSRIILEMLADMNDTLKFYLEKGFEKKDAIRRVEEKFDFSDNNLEELVKIHKSPTKTFLDNLSQQAKLPIEKILMLLVIIFILAFSGKLVFSNHFFQLASKFVYPVMGLASSMIILAIYEFFKIYIKQNHDIKKIRKGLDELLLLGCLSLFVGFFGFFYELNTSGQKVIPSIARIFFDTTLPTGDQSVLKYLMDWGLKSSSMIMTSLTTALITAIIWYILINKIQAIEKAEVEFLLNN